MGWPKDSKRAEAGKAKMVVKRIAREILARMADQFDVARSSDRWGIITVYNALVMVKGIYRRGSTIPDTIPKRDTAWLLVIQLAISLCGIRMVLTELIAVIISRVKVMGSAMLVIIEMRDIIDVVAEPLIKFFVL